MTSFTSILSELRLVDIRVEHIANYTTHYWPICFDRVPWVQNLMTPGVVVIPRDGDDQAQAGLELKNWLIADANKHGEYANDRSFVISQTTISALLHSTSVEFTRPDGSGCRIRAVPVHVYWIATAMCDALDYMRDAHPEAATVLQAVYSSCFTANGVHMFWSSLGFMSTSQLVTVLPPDMVRRNVTADVDMALEEVLDERVKWSDGSTYQWPAAVLNRNRDTLDRAFDIAERAARKYKPDQLDILAIREELTRSDNKKRPHRKDGVNSRSRTG